MYKDEIAMVKSMVEKAVEDAKKELRAEFEARIKAAQAPTVKLQKKEKE